MLALPLAHTCAHDKGYLKLRSPAPRSHKPVPLLNLSRAVYRRVLRAPRRSGNHFPQLHPTTRLLDNRVGFRAVHLLRHYTRAVIE